MRAHLVSVHWEQINTCGYRKHYFLRKCNQFSLLYLFKHEISPSDVIQIWTPEITGNLSWPLHNRSISFWTITSFDVHSKRALRACGIRRENLADWFDRVKLIEALNNAILRHVDLRRGTGCCWCYKVICRSIQRTWLWCFPFLFLQRDQKRLWSHV